MVFPQPDPLRPEAEPPPREESAPARPVDRNLLERVLQETMAEVSVSSSELSALAEIGRKYCGQPLTEQIAGELVGAIINHRLPNAGLAGHQRQAMLEQIAESFMEDPPSEQRLRGLWARLSEGAQ